MVKSSKLKSVYGKKTVEDQRQIYKDWAETYDVDTTTELGWIGFKPAAAEFSKRITNKSARILDVGCGTGLSGMALADVGYTDLDGCDLSPEMLSKAKEKGVYVSLSEVDLTKDIEITRPYDAVFSCGVFGFGPPYPEHLKHLTAVLKPGGYAIVTVNGKGWIEKDWEQALPEAVEKHSLALEEIVDIQYLENEDIDGKLLIFKG